MPQPSETPDRIERLALSAIKTADDVRAALALGLSPTCFKVDAHRLAWERLIESATSGKALPGPADLAELGVELIDGATDLEAHVRELVRFNLSQRARNVLMRYVPGLDANPADGIRVMVGDLSELMTATSVHVGYSDKGAKDRLAEVRRRAEAHDRGEIIGIPTGLWVFDEEGYPWQEGEVISIIGIPTSGKSWLLAYFSVVAYLHGKRILMISPENSKLEMEWRIDVLMSAKDEGDWDLSHTALRRGTADLDRYAAWCEKVSWRNDWVTVDAGERGDFSVEDVIALTREHRPDVLAIDGFHLLTGKGKSWEVMFESAKRIKGLSQGLGLVTICVTQATREAAVIQEDTPEMHQAAYGHAIMEDSNRIISMAKVRGNQKRRIFRVVKFRDGPEIPYRQYLNFDVDRGDIFQLKPEEGGRGGVTF